MFARYLNLHPDSPIPLFNVYQVGLFLSSHSPRVRVHNIRTWIGGEMDWPQVWQLLGDGTLGARARTFPFRSRK